MYTMELRNDGQVTKGAMELEARSLVHFVLIRWIGNVRNTFCAPGKRSVDLLGVLTKELQFNGRTA